MSDILLRELSNIDIDWLSTTGRQETIPAGKILLQSGVQPEALYLLLDGTLSIRLQTPVTASVHQGVESVREEDCGDRDIAQLSQGEIIGESVLFNTSPLSAAICAAEEAIVLSIPHQPLLSKLQRDVEFSARFYRALALILSERLRHLLEMPGQIRFAGNQPMKDVLFVFGDLWDSDVDWLTAVGNVEQLSPRQVLIQAGRPIDALYIVLDGLLSVAVPEAGSTPLTLCFECTEKSASTETPIATYSKGEMSGTISFLDFRLPPVTIRAIQESLVLAIPRHHMAIRLQQDRGFAARFYRVLAIQLSYSLQSVLSRMGCSQSDHDSQSQEGAIADEDELDLDALQSVSQGAARFNWMLSRLGVSCSLM